MKTVLSFLCFTLCSIAVAAKDGQQQVKNVLFIVSDDLKASVLGCYGDPVCRTPNIDRLASQGMLFERAYCQGTSCGPSRTSFMRSRYLDKAGVTLGEHLQAQGFYSARVGKIFHMRVPGDIIAGTDGQDVPTCWTERFNAQGREAHTPGNYACLNLNIFTTDLENRQSTRMPHRMFVTVDYKGDGSDQPDHKAATKTIELLRQRAKKKNADKPFFLACGFVRPHYPNVAPEQYFDPYPFEKIVMPETPEDDWDDIPEMGITSSNSKKHGIDKYPDNQKRMWSGYYATVTFMDEQVGRVLDELERLGLRDETAVIFTSDHGYHLGEHHFWQKVNLHEEVVRVPLIMSVPGHESGRSDSIAELVDIFPTVTELVGAETPESAEGKSLAPVLRYPTASVKEAAWSFVKNGTGMRTTNHAYMRYKDGSEELYDMEADPKQFTNIAKEPDQSGTLKRLRATMGEKFPKRKQNSAKSVQ